MKIHFPELKKAIEDTELKAGKGKGNTAEKMGNMK